MNNIQVAMTAALTTPLTTAIKADVPTCLGLSYNAGAGVLTIHLPDDASAAQIALAEAAAAAHDPVILDATRDGDTVTLNILKPRNMDAATEITLTLNGVTAPDATALTANAAQEIIVSVDPVTIGVLVYPHEEVTL